MKIEKRIAELERNLAFWKMVKEASDMQCDTFRDRVVIRTETKGEEFIGTCNYKVDTENGWVTVHFKDGNKVAVRPHNWSTWDQMTARFGITRRQVIIDDPRPGE